MSQQEVFKFLVKECHLTFEEIGDLNDYQISKILCLPDRRPMNPHG